MKGATCNFCGGSFRNRQAVRAHLKGCAAYRRMPKASEPSTGTEPQAPALGKPSAAQNATRSARRPVPDSPRSRRRVQRFAPEAAPETWPGDGVHQELDPGVAEPDLQARQQEQARQRERDREAARLLLITQQEVEARERRGSAEREAKERRRATIQRVKYRVIRRWWALNYTIPAPATAQALKEVETELSRLPVDELPESELVAIAEGVRDRIYQPIMQTQDQARKEEERKHQQARRREQLIASGVTYANRELREEEDLDGWTRLEIAQKVKRILEQEVADDESEADLEARVDEILDRELDAVDEQRRAKARPELIAHGTAYATRELLRVTDLDVWERSRIEGVVKRELDREITGEESEDDIEDLVEQILDDELGEP